MRVLDSGIRVRLGEIDDLGVSVRPVLDDTAADVGQVEDTVDQVRSPVEVESASGHGPAIHAQAINGAAVVERQRADVGLLSRVPAAPVARPAVLVAEPVWVVAAEKVDRLVRGEDSVVPSNDLGRGGGAKVLLVMRRGLALLLDVVLGVLDDLVGIVKGPLEDSTLGAVAGLVDREHGLHASVPLVSRSGRGSYGDRSDRDLCLALRSSDSREACNCGSEGGTHDEKVAAEER